MTEQHQSNCLLLLLWRVTGTIMLVTLLHRVAVDSRTVLRTVHQLQSIRLSNLKLLFFPLRLLKALHQLSLQV